jgi:hypothetical protein
VVIGNGLTSIASYLFDGCTSLKSVAIGTSVTSIGDFAFNNCTNLTSVTIPNSVTSIGGFTFQSCINLTNVTIGNHVISIGQAAFYSCTALRSVAIPDNVTSIGGGCCGGAAFGDCTSLTNVVIGNGLTSIASYLFDGCTSLKSVAIGTSVTSIGDDAFYYCTNLTSVYFKANAPSLGSYVFYGDNNATVFYLAGTTGWGTTFGGRPTARWLASLIVTPVTTTLYGSLLVGSNMNLSFTVYNAGSMTISGTATVVTSFSVVSGGSYTLAPGQSTNTTIRYAPTAAGNNSAYVLFTGGGASQTLQVTGSAYTDPTATTGSIAGRVTRASDGSPMNGVTISVTVSGAGNGTQSPQAVTGGSGSQAGGYSVSGLRPNTHYSVTAMPPTPLRLNGVTTNEITVVAGQTKTVNIALTSTSQPPAATPTNTPVVLVRGYGPDTEWAVDDSNSWSAVRSALVASGFTNVWDCNQPEPTITNSLGKTGHFINGTNGIDANAASLRSYIQQKAMQYKINHGGYYPPQIHIIAHSMGGLFTRGALGNNANFMFASPSFTVPVGKVVMLATPNCGSKVADYGFQVGGGGLLMDIFHMHWASTTNLQTSEMIGHYNPSHPWPSVPLYLFSGSNSKYASQKGLQLPTAWNGNPDWCPITGAFIWDMNIWNGVPLTDEQTNDGLATKPSVNGVFWAWGLQWPPLHQVTSVALNPVQSITDSDLGRSLDHFFLLKDSAVVGWVVNTLTNPAPTPTPYTAIPSVKPLGGPAQQTIPLQTFESLAGTVTNMAVVALPVTSDAITTLTFQLMASDTNISFRLNDPSGKRIDANTPQTNANVQYTASAVASNLLQATFTIANPTGGVWTAVIDASSMTTTQAAYSLMVFGDSNVGLIPQTASLFAPGQDAVVSCVLADFSTNPVVAVSNASITATIRLPDGTMNYLTLFDDGWHNDGAPNDGLYAAVLANVQQGGMYSISYRATGTNAQGHALQRVATGTFSVSSGNGSVLGDPIYVTVDTDDDGIADFLEVKCWVNPTVAGNYILAGQLVDVTELHSFAESAQFYADGTGPMQVTLIFDLAEMRAAGGQGTYHIENLQLFEVTGSGTAWLDAYQGSSVVNIQAPTKAINIGVWSNQFGFTITGSNSLVIVVEACTNLATPVWFPVATNTLTGGSSYFSDPQWTNSPGRFYRLRSP